MALILKKSKESVADPKERTYKATKAELAAMRKGEAAFARGEFVTLNELKNELDRIRRKASDKTDRKVSC